MTSNSFFHSPHNISNPSIATAAAAAGVAAGNRLSLLHARFLPPHSYVFEEGWFVLTASHPQARQSQSHHQRVGGTAKPKIGDTDATSAISMTRPIQVGALSRNILSTMIRNGRITPSCLCWHSEIHLLTGGQDGWQPIERIGLLQPMKLSNYSLAADSSTSSSSSPHSSSTSQSFVGANPSAFASVSNALMTLDLSIGRATSSSPFEETKHTLAHVPSASSRPMVSLSSAPSPMLTPPSSLIHHAIILDEVMDMEDAFIADLRTLLARTTPATEGMQTSSAIRSSSSSKPSLFHHLLDILSPLLHKLLQSHLTFRSAVGVYSKTLATQIGMFYSPHHRTSLTNSSSCDGASLSLPLPLPSLSHSSFLAFLPLDIPRDHTGIHQIELCTELPPISATPRKTKKATNHSDNSDAKNDQSSTTTSNHHYYAYMFSLARLIHKYNILPVFANSSTTAAMDKFASSSSAPSSCFHVDDSSLDDPSSASSDLASLLVATLRPPLPSQFCARQFSIMTTKLASALRMRRQRFRATAQTIPMTVARTETPPSSSSSSAALDANTTSASTSFDSPPLRPLSSSFSFGSPSPSPSVSSSPPIGVGIGIGVGVGIGIGTGGVLNLIPSSSSPTSSAATLARKLKRSSISAALEQIVEGKEAANTNTTHGAKSDGTTKSATTSQTFTFDTTATASGDDDDVRAESDAHTNDADASARQGGGASSFSASGERFAASDEIHSLTPSQYAALLRPVVHLAFHGLVLKELITLHSSSSSASVPSSAAASSASSVNPSPLDGSPSSSPPSSSPASTSISTSPPSASASFVTRSFSLMSPSELESLWHLFHSCAHLLTSYSRESTLHLMRLQLLAFERAIFRSPLDEVIVRHRIATPAQPRRRYKHTIRAALVFQLNHGLPPSIMKSGGGGGGGGGGVAQLASNQFTGIAPTSSGVVNSSRAPGGRHLVWFNWFIFTDLIICGKPLSNSNPNSSASTHTSEGGSQQGAGDGDGDSDLFAPCTYQQAWTIDPTLTLRIGRVVSQPVSSTAPTFGAAKFHAPSSTVNATGTGTGTDIGTDTAAAAATSSLDLYPLELISSSSPIGGSSRARMTIYFGNERERASAHGLIADALNEQKLFACGHTAEVDLLASPLSCIAHLPASVQALMHATSAVAPVSDRCAACCAPLLPAYRPSAWCRTCSKAVCRACVVGGTAPSVTSLESVSPSPSPPPLTHGSSSNRHRSEENGTRSTSGTSTTAATNTTTTSSNNDMFQSDRCLRCRPSKQSWPDLSSTCFALTQQSSRLLDAHSPALSPSLTQTTTATSTVATTTSIAEPTRVTDSKSVSTNASAHGGSDGAGGGAGASRSDMSIDLDSVLRSSPECSPSLRRTRTVTSSSSSSSSRPTIHRTHSSRDSRGREMTWNDLLLPVHGITVGATGHVAGRRLSQLQSCVLNSPPTMPVRLVSGGGGGGGGGGSGESNVSSPSVASLSTSPVRLEGFKPSSNIVTGGVRSQSHSNAILSVSSLSSSSSSYSTSNSSSTFSPASVSVSAVPSLRVDLGSPTSPASSHSRSHSHHSHSHSHSASVSSPMSMSGGGGGGENGSGVCTPSTCSSPRQGHPSGLALQLLKIGGTHQQPPQIESISMAANCPAQLTLGHPSSASSGDDSPTHHRSLFTGHGLIIESGLVSATLPATATATATTTTTTAATRHGSSSITLAPMTPVPYTPRREKSSSSSTTTSSPSIVGHVTHEVGGDSTPYTPRARGHIFGGSLLTSGLIGPTSSSSPFHSPHSSSTTSSISSSSSSSASTSNSSSAAHSRYGSHPDLAGLAFPRAYLDVNWQVEVVRARELQLTESNGRQGKGRYTTYDIVMKGHLPEPVYDSTTDATYLAGVIEFDASKRYSEFHTFDAALRKFRKQTRSQSSSHASNAFSVPFNAGSAPSVYSPHGHISSPISASAATASGHTSKFKLPSFPPSVMFERFSSQVVEERRLAFQQYLRELLNMTQSQSSTNAHTSSGGGGGGGTPSGVGSHGMSGFYTSLHDVHSHTDLEEDDYLTTIRTMVLNFLWSKSTATTGTHHPQTPQHQSHAHANGTSLAAFSSSSSSSRPSETLESP